MIVKTQIIQGKYLDSVKLMLISKELREQEGVIDAVAILATSENREILVATDMMVDAISAARETDIVIVVKTKTEDAALSALNKAEVLLKAPAAKGSSSKVPIHNLNSALKSMNSANLCLISVAGKYAAQEADSALDRGLHVMIFSDNVSLEDELRLKQKAISKGLLLMGPDCGTAIINGCPLGFANAVPKGKIGIVSAAGTGLQEVSAAIANRGCGISQAFGTGGRDGKAEIGGIMLSACLDFLIDDPETELIILIGKTPDPEVRAKLWKQIAGTDKPVIVSFLQAVETPILPNLEYIIPLDACAARACDRMGISNTEPVEQYTLLQLPPERKYLIGLYSGGTLCYEAQNLYVQYFNSYPLSNTPILAEYKTEDVFHTKGDCFVDLGSDEFTVGRAHPMIDYSLRLKLLEQISSRGDVALILLDIVLGYGSNPDPAKELIPVLAHINKEIPVICHVLGTDTDPQDTMMQAGKLREAGAIVFRSHHAAADYALRCVQQQRRNK